MLALSSGCQRQDYQHFIIFIYHAHSYERNTKQILVYNDERPSSSRCAQLVCLIDDLFVIWFATDAVLPRKPPK